MKIEWHKYPEEKPEGYTAIWIAFKPVGIIGRVEIGYYNDYLKYFRRSNDAMLLDNVTHWAYIEIPEYPEDER